MSATELLERVKTLPPRERRRFFAGVHEMEEVDQTPSNVPQKAVRWPNASVRRRRIFGNKLVPNLVLLAREQERY